MKRVLRLCALLLALDAAALAQPPESFLNPMRELEQTAPAEAQELTRRAVAAMTRNDLAAAKRDFEKILTLIPDNIPTTINLSLIAYQRKEYPQAEKLLKKVARAEPESGLPWLLLGVIYYDQEKFEAALAALAQAVLYAPKDARAHHFLGVTIGRKGWLSGAEEELRKAIALNPDYGEAHFNLAIFYLQHTPPAIELARRHYQKSLDLGGAVDAVVEKRLTAE